MAHQAPQNHDRSNGFRLLQLRYCHLDPPIVQTGPQSSVFESPLLREIDAPPVAKNRTVRRWSSKAMATPIAQSSASKSAERA